MLGSAETSCMKKGGVYEIEGQLEMCRNGFHFCEDLLLTSFYYTLDQSLTVYAEVEALGEVKYREDKAVTINKKLYTKINSCIILIINNDQALYGSYHPNK